MQTPTGQQTVLPSYEQAVRNPTAAEYQSATAPYTTEYTAQPPYPVQAPYPVQTQNPTSAPYPTQAPYPIQAPYSIQTSHPAQPLYLNQQPPYPTQQSPYPTQQSSYPIQQSSYPIQQSSYPTQPASYIGETYGQVIAPPLGDGGQTIHVIRHVSTGNTGCSGKRGAWFGVLLGLIVLVLLFRLAND